MRFSHRSFLLIGIGFSQLFSASIFASDLLWDKAVEFENRARATVNAFGLVGGSDDQPIWNGAYVAAESYRVTVTQGKDEEALKYMEQTLWGLHALHEVTGIPGLIARKIDPIQKDPHGNPVVLDGYHMGQGKFQTYMWKGQLSFDQYLGYLYGISEAWPNIRNPDLKNAIREDIRAIGSHYLSHHEKIEGPDTHLDFSINLPFENHLPQPLKFIMGDLLPPSGGHAMYALHLLKVAAYVTEDPSFENAYLDMIKKRKYGEIVRDDTQGHTEQLVRQFLGAINLYAKLHYGWVIEATPDSLRSDVAVNLGHIALYNLSRLESDPAIRPYFLEGFKRTHDTVANQSNTYWNFMARAENITDDFAVRDGIDSLNRFPMDDYGKRSNSGDPQFPKSSKYKGLSANFFKGDHWKWYSHAPLPFEKRPMHSFAWQQNPYMMDGQFGNSDCPGVAYLVAYWLGRKQGYIAAH